VGWNSGDEIHANGGDDTIYGLDGSDYIDAGAGNDQAMGMQCSAAYQETILGGSGNDTLYGYRTYQGGNLCPRVIQGDAGLDILHGAPGPDWIYGGTDRDELYGYDGYDRCYGGTGGAPPEDDWCEASPSCNERPECER
jgi:Ca2+-binding RTX toxin-like protein